jgi:peptidyl-prolyl cis-trans isomerase B (cyclophilin B)
VSATKREREREYARRRYERWESRRRAQAARRRRAVITWVVVGAVVVSTLTGAIILTATNDAPPDIPSAPVEPAALPTTSPTLYDAPPPADEAQGRAWPVTIRTSAGDLAVELDGAAAPQAVASFLMLARGGFFDGTACHRLVAGSLIQCGDPTATGAGGPGYSFGPVENAPADGVYQAGTVAMARRAGDAQSQGSQFFIVFADTTLPDDNAGGYTVFGRVIEGLDLLTGIDAGGTVDGGADGQPAVPLTIEGVVVQ